MKKYDDMGTTKFPPIPEDIMEDDVTAEYPPSEETPITMNDNDEPDTTPHDDNQVDTIVDDRPVEEESVDTGNPESPDNLDDTEENEGEQNIRYPRYFWGEPQGAIHPQLTDAFVSVSLGIIITIMLVSFWVVMINVTTNVG